MPEMTNYHQPYEAAWRHFFFERLKFDSNRQTTFVEVGSYEGSSTLWIMNNLLRSPESRLVCIDAWAPEGGGEERYGRFLQNIAELPGRDRIDVIRDWSHNALRQLIARGVKADFLYIDGGHDAPTVLRDLVTGFDIVKKGGFVICDDYLWNDARWGGNRTLGRPKIAIDAFTTIFADKIQMVWGMPNIQVWFQKIAD
jgi:predicted O-methyltransferase YrrM